MCDVPRCGSWSMQINQLPKQNLSWLALAGAHRSQNSVAVFWPEVEEVPSVLTPGPALFLSSLIRASPQRPPQLTLGLHSPSCFALEFPWASGSYT